MAPETTLPFEARIADGFLPTIGRYDRADLEDHPGAIIGLRTNLRLGYLNPAWFRFARDNGGEPRISREWPLGRAITDSWPADSPRWDWVEAWATNFPRATSHGLCPTCYRFHYPPLNR